MSGRVGGRYVAPTVAIIVLSAVSSLLGLLREGHYNDDPALLPRLFANDLAISVVAVPAFAVAYLRKFDHDIGRGGGTTG